MKKHPNPTAYIVGRIIGLGIMAIVLMGTMAGIAAVLKLLLTVLGVIKG